MYRPTVLELEAMDSRRPMKSETLEFVIVVANTFTLAVGGIVTLLAVRAYRRTRNRALRPLAIGLGAIVAGTLLGGGIHQSGLAALLVGVAVQSAFIAVGFLLLGWSLLHREPAGDRETLVKFGGT